MFKEKFYESMNKLEIYKDCVENHSSVTRWHYFFSPYKSFQFFPKTNCFRVRRKLITYETNYRKRPNHFLMSSSYFHSLSLSYSLTPLPPVLSVQTATNLVELERLVNLTTRSVVPNRWVPVCHLVRLGPFIRGKIRRVLFFLV